MPKIGSALHIYHTETLRMIIEMENETRNRGHSLQTCDGIVPKYILIHPVLLTYDANPLHTFGANFINHYTARVGGDWFWQTKLGNSGFLYINL